MEKAKRKRSLTRKFTMAVLGLTATAACLYGAWFGAFYAGRGEALTPSETSAVTSIFGDEINANAIRKHERTEGSATHIFRWVDGMVPPPFSHIDFFGDNAHARDYTREDKRLFSLFMHEVTHAWQGQNFNFSRHNVGQYAYTLQAGSKFSDFGTEQQADIISDYAGKFMHRSGIGQTRTAEDLLLRDVVEARFPTAMQTRLAMEQGRMQAFRTEPAPILASPSITPKPVPTPPRPS
jgi:hypothetical protein